MNFYFESAGILDRLDAKQGSIKSIIAKLPEKDRKRSAALVIETLKYKTVLSAIIRESDLIKQEKKITSLNLALVLVHDLLLSGGIQAGDGPIKKAILRHKTRLNAELQKIKAKRGVRSNSDLAQCDDERAAQIPRYVRVNTLLWTTEEAIKTFIAQGFHLEDWFSSSQSFAKDLHVANLLLFPPNTALHENPGYKSGKLILQDKASCFPATILSPDASDDMFVIDATAAPGNKTSHLSALMGNKGKLFAFERDRKRFATLEMMLSKAGCRNVVALNKDFLSIDPVDSQFAKVTHILVDPSCSGSGIVNRLDHLLDAEEETGTTMETRLSKLSAFQFMMVKHAMRFPSAQKIVYSTCSTHAVENEHVVRAALKSLEAKAGSFTLAPRSEVLPVWDRRGLPEEMDFPGDAASLVRCSPGEDGTNGFFVACFVKNDVSRSGEKRKGSFSDQDVDKPRKKKKSKRL